jgi:ADP-ribose pyrophosphatase YjhB (NUDIX family)
MRGIVARAIRDLERHIGDPHHGLPEELFLFLSKITPLVNVDLLIRDERHRTLMTWREDVLYGAGWHLPGGIIRIGETAADRVRQVARRELNADVEFEGTPLVLTESIDPASPARRHMIALLFRCRITGGLDECHHSPAGRPLAGEWRWQDDCPADIIPAQQMYIPLISRP